jgi:hypothetical protein
VITFIGEISRKATSGQVPSDKKPSRAKAALVSAVDEALHVWGIWADNGVESLKDSAAVLKELGIQHTHTRNPEPEGEIQRLSPWRPSMCRHHRQ